MQFEVKLFILECVKGKLVLTLFTINEGIEQKILSITFYMNLLSSKQCYCCITRFFLNAENNIVLLRLSVLCLDLYSDKYTFLHRWGCFPCFLFIVYSRRRTENFLSVYRILKNLRAFIIPMATF